MCCIATRTGWKSASAARCARRPARRCIFVESSENTDDKRYSPGERYASTYEINMLRCIYCGFCEDACPTEAITWATSTNYPLPGAARRFIRRRC